ncbi:hypothetical protein [Anaerophaga thermohalophila]|jgi:hypothetical protein|nr:hypothetical protein [Anaerophaga thermohalophila]
MLKKSILLLFFFMAGLGLMAQQTVTGVVTDSSDELGVVPCFRWEAYNIN